MSTSYCNVEVQPDERLHERIFPAPPIADLVHRLPHDWLTAFQDIADWRVQAMGATDLKIRKCTYRPLFCRTHVDITWSSTADAKILFFPPKPLALPDTWNAVDFWVGGVPDRHEGAWVECTLHMTGVRGDERQLDICGKDAPRRLVAVDMFHRLVPNDLCSDVQGGLLTAIEIRIPGTDSPGILQLFSLAVYVHESRRRYARPDKLPFPTHPDGVVPTPRLPGTACVEQGAGNGAETRFSWTGTDGSEVTYIYRPRNGTLEDLSVSLDGEESFKPCIGGGLVLERPGARLTPAYTASESVLLGQKLQGDCLQTRWKALLGDETVRYGLSLRLVRRSLVIEAEVDGPYGLEMRIGYPNHPAEKRAIEIPMLVWDAFPPDPSQDYDQTEVNDRMAGRARSPAVLLAGDVFLTALFDWYVSDASFLYSTSARRDEAAGYDGGAYYLPVIDRGRNPLREELILTASKDVQEVLPNIPNPPSSYTELMTDRVYSHGGIAPSDSLQKYRSLDITKVATLVGSYHAASDRGGYRRTTDAGSHGDWIDDPTKTRGGLARKARLAAQFRKLGWLIGTGTNYTLMSPLFPWFAELPKVHDANGYYRTNWPGSMVPTAGDALSYMRRQTRKLQAQLEDQLMYDDQRTMVPIWNFTDFAPDAPAAGTFRASYEQIAQLYMERREIVGGPILSEGGMHWMYSGLIDGNIARIQHWNCARPHKWYPESSNPWSAPADIVDFNLLKIRPLTVDFGGNDYFDHWVPELRDMCICQTLAYGKTGMWVKCTESGQETLAMSVRTYYTFLHTQKRYRYVAVETIRYHDGDRLVDTSTIIRAGKERLGRIYVRYANRFESWTNLNGATSWVIRVDDEDVELPPWGWYQRRKEEWGEFRNINVLGAGNKRFVRVEDRNVLMIAAAGSIVGWPDIESDGCVVVRRHETGSTRVINVDSFHLRVRSGLLGSAAVAGQARIRVFDIDGSLVGECAIPTQSGWVDLSFLAHEQFAEF